ncbi:MAG: hypothetical protein FP824_03780 [Euryarchaeota archaeon]|nr:hypothetical protein [Euryarchaeota archaeon]
MKFVRLGLLTWKDVRLQKGATVRDLKRVFKLTQYYNVYRCKTEIMLNYNQDIFKLLEEGEFLEISPPFML